ncbi:MAG TPA: 50S ribosomal protein L25/general stress protein Ctc [Actinomycetota bacterium]|nr:50S ribosomal protein L25/general stress protein Ctc [Actinomycetota bacterium]
MELKLVAERREGTGKGVARKLRAAGRVPAVVYGQGLESTAVSVDAKELFHVLHAGGANVLLDVVLDGKAQLALARDVQRDHIHGRFIHVDFLAVSRTEKITIAIPVRVVGESVGVKAGGVLEHHLWEIQAECLPGDVPDAIDADVSALEVGDSIKVSDLVAPSGVTILSPEEEPVLAVVPPQAREVEEVEEVEGEAEAEAAAEGEAPEAGAEAPSAEEGGEGE